MLASNDHDQLKKGIKKIWGIWCGIFYCLAAYIYICHKYPDIRIEVGQGFPRDEIKYVLYVISAFEIYLIQAIRKRMLSVDPSDRLRVSRDHSHPNALSVISKYTSVVIVSIAIAESVAIYGFGLFILGASYKTLHLFVGLAALAMLFYRPRMNELEHYASALNLKSSTNG